MRGRASDGSDGVLENISGTGGVASIVASEGREGTLTMFAQPPPGVAIDAKDDTRFMAPFFILRTKMLQQASNDHCDVKIGLNTVRLRSIQEHR